MIISNIITIKKDIHNELIIINEFYQYAKLNYEISLKFDNIFNREVFIIYVTLFNITTSVTVNDFNSKQTAIQIHNELTGYLNKQYRRLGD